MCFQIRQRGCAESSVLVPRLLELLLLMAPFPRLDGAWDLTTSWLLEQVVGVEFLGYYYFHQPLIPKQKRRAIVVCHESEITSK